MGPGAGKREVRGNLCFRAGIVKLMKPEAVLPRSAPRTFSLSAEASFPLTNAAPDGSIRSLSCEPGCCFGVDSEIGVDDVDRFAVAHLHAAAVFQDGGLCHRPDALDDFTNRGV